MAVRSTMAALIARVRVLINDPPGASQIFDDQTIQDVLDASRIDVINQPLEAQPTFSGSTILYLDYFSSMGDFEDSPVLRQYLTQVVTPNTSENIVGHWTFATSTLPPVAITGRSFDIYRGAADLLERMAAKWVLRYNISVDGQNLQRGGVTVALHELAKTYREKQRVQSLSLTRGDISNGSVLGVGLAPTEIDYMS